MISYNCKMCGAVLEVSENDKICTCKYCESVQTLPRLTDDKKNKLFARADHFRRNNEYDKAIALVDEMLNEDATDSEIYWYRILCTYGIEYVEEGGKRVPTINRMQYKSVFADENYKEALKYADDSQLGIYEEEAKKIDYLQRNILKIAQRENPFDVFLCYKRTDDEGNRTIDSVMANDLYHQLKQEGFKVFFAEITLENKLGKDYEPYIFSALNSAKVMLVIGTNVEYFSAPWVKNEWSRFLNIANEKGDRQLIPCYKNVNPLDLPEEFSHLQLQDMSKIGFVTDIIRGIKKIVNKKINNNFSSGVDMMVDLAAEIEIEPNPNEVYKRGVFAIEDNDWNKATEMFTYAENLEPTSVKKALKREMTVCHFETYKEYEEYHMNLMKNYKREYVHTDAGLYQYFLSIKDKYVIDNYLENMELLNQDFNFSSYYVSKPYFENLYNDFINFNWVKNITENDEPNDCEDEIVEMYKRLDAEYKKRIAEFAIIDEESKEEWTKRLDLAKKQVASNLESMYEKANEDRERDYQKAITRLKKSIWPRTMDDVIGSLKYVGYDYKDSKEYARKAKIKKNTFIILTITAAVVATIIIAIILFTIR